MTLPQAFAFSILGGAVLLFAWGRFRYDLVALGALLAGLVTGVVPAKAAFSGFTSDVVVIIACALVLSAAVARSGVTERFLQPLLSRLKTPATQVPAMAGATAVLSMGTKNVGALAILMPVALKLARTTKTSPSSILMPMSFMSLLGGLVTLVGTSTNIIVSQVREETVGKPFQMFDFAPVGLVLTAIGLVFVSVGWRFLPRDRQGLTGLGDAVRGPYATEATLPESGEDAPASVAALKLADSNVKLVALLRDGAPLRGALRKARLKPGDTLVFEGEHDDLSELFNRTRLIQARAHRQIETDQSSDEVRSIEAVLQPDSILVGRSAKRVDLQQQFGVNLLAVARSGARITSRLRDVTLRAGDVLVLQAGEKTLPSALQALGVLPLAEREVRLGDVRPRYLPIVILAVAMVLVALKIAPVAIAFFGAAVLVVAVGALSMREAYGALEAQVLVLIGALTPLSDAVRTTGGADLIANGLAGLMHGQPGLLTLGALMVTAMACSPFLHNAPTVLVLGPIAVALARHLHLSPDPFLMAVATGAGCDFLTPIGHQSNMLVMGPGGYRFGDYWKLGLPLSVLVIMLGAPMIVWVWPLIPH
jgi:di/tricarboxylate transporter